MIFALMLLATQTASAATPSPSMVVTEKQFSDALAICRKQIIQSQFTEGELPAAGWIKAISSVSDGKSTGMAGYRHPDNMMLVTLMTIPTASDKCVVMAPTGAAFSRAQAVSAVEALTPGSSRRAGDIISWSGRDADVELASMGTIGVRVSFTKKGGR